MNPSIDNAEAALPQLFDPRPSGSPARTPVVRIKPPQRWEGVDFRQLWSEREVLYFLMWRDVKVRYKQTVIGVSWVVLQPILITIVFAIFLGRLIKVPSDDMPYPIFAYTSLLLWTFVSNAILSSSYSLVTNAHIITRVYFPRLLMPAAAIGVRLLDFLIGAVVLMVLMTYYHVTVTRTALLFPLFVLMVTLLTLAIGFLGASLNVRYRDVGTILPILLQAWMFVSPIAYSSAVVPARLHFLYSLNPLVGIVDGFRASLFHLPFDWPSIITSAAVSVPLFIASVYIFRRMEMSFADDV
jgi:lipopolysaccharide transport system permease protein